MTYTFGRNECPEESHAFTHGTFRVSVHLHAVYSTPSLFEQYKDRDPFLAWIYVRRQGKEGIARTLNAQYDAMMKEPFFLNVHEDWGGHSIPGSGRSSPWTREELEQAVKDYLDSLAPEENLPTVAESPSVEQGAGTTPRKRRWWWPFS